MKLLLNNPLFEYDIRGLLMAFYPAVKFSTDESDEDSRVLRVDYSGNIDGAQASSTITAGISFSDGTFSDKKEVKLDLSDRSKAKTVLKQVIYGMLSKANGKLLPWGTLTGIRPTKIPMAMLSEGKSEEEIRFHMEKELLCSEHKTGTAIDIAKRERSLLSKLDIANGFSLYIGIPFCPTTCLYCSFTSYPIGAYKNRVKDYLHALEKEIDYAKEAFKGKKPDTIYFGGGTPTTLEPDELKWLIDKVCDSFDLSNLLEWTVEAGRPDSVTREKLEVIKNSPVTRISINPQTMHQNTLDLIGRHHTTEQIRDAFTLARSMGFSNINMDLILGLPGETKEDMLSTVDEIIKMNPDNVTIHSLALKRSARLNLMWDRYSSYKMENSDELMNQIEKRLRDSGQNPYYLYRQKNMAGNQENTGYAREGKEGIYNILIMEEVETILALGAGATTKRVNGSLITRAENVKDVKTYIDNIDEMIERKKKLFEDSGKENAETVDFCED